MWIDFIFTVCVDIKFYFCTVITKQNLSLFCYKIKNEIKSGNKVNRNRFFDHWL